MGDHDLNINLLLFTMHANIVLFNNNTCRKNRNDNVPKWMIIFQIIF